MKFLDRVEQLVGILVPSSEAVQVIADIRVESIHRSVGAEAIAHCSPCVDQDISVLTQPEEK